MNKGVSLLFQTSLNALPGVDALRGTASNVKKGFLSYLVSFNAQYFVFCLIQLGLISAHYVSLGQGGSLLLNIVNFTREH